MDILLTHLNFSFDHSSLKWSPSLSNKVLPHKTSRHTFKLWPFLSMMKRKNFRTPPPPNPNPFDTKTFRFCNNTKVISQVLFLAPTFSSAKKEVRVIQCKSKWPLNPFCCTFSHGQISLVKQWSESRTQPLPLVSWQITAEPLLSSWLWSYLAVRRFRNKFCTVPAHGKQTGNNSFFEFPLFYFSLTQLVRQYLHFAFVQCSLV